MNRMKLGVSQFCCRLREDSVSKGISTIPGLGSLGA